MSMKLVREMEWLRALNSGFRYFCTVHSQCGQEAMQKPYKTTRLYVEHKENIKGMVYYSGREYAKIPRYDFGWLLTLHLVRKKYPREVVLSSWYLAGHEWGHWVIYRKGELQSEEKADEWAFNNMRKAGFNEREIEESEESFEMICELESKYDK